MKRSGSLCFITENITIVEIRSNKSFIKVINVAPGSMLSSLVLLVLFSIALQVSSKVNVESNKIPNCF